MSWSHVLARVFITLAFFFAQAEWAEARSKTPVCTPWSVNEVMALPSLIFMGQIDRLEADHVVQFNNSIFYKGVEPIRPRVKMPETMSFRLDQTIMVAAFGNFENGYTTTECALAQVSDKNPLFQDIFSALSLYKANFEDKYKMIGPELDLLVPMRETAAYAYSQKSGEVAARLYKLALTISKDEPIDLLRAGQALLLADNPREALARFDDILEKDGHHQDAWLGRYQALAQMNRWSELPSPLPPLQGLPLFERILPNDLNLERADLSNAMLRKVNANHLLAAHASFEKAFIVESLFKDATLTGVNFNAAYLRDVDFTGADLTGATFVGADLRNIIWPKNYTPPVPEK